MPAGDDTGGVIRFSGHPAPLDQILASAEAKAHGVGLQGGETDQNGIGFGPEFEQAGMVRRRTKSRGMAAAGGNFPIGGKGKVGGDAEGHGVVGRFGGLRDRRSPEWIVSQSRRMANNLVLRRKGKSWSDMAEMGLHGCAFHGIGLTIAQI